MSPVELLEDAAKYEPQATLAIRHPGQGCVLRLVLEYPLQSHQVAWFHSLMLLALCLWVTETANEMPSAKRLNATL
jgi:hypothetical protein